MEPEGSILCSQEPTTDPYPEPDTCNPHLLYFSKIHSNIIFPCTPRSSKWSLTIGFSDQHFVLISHYSHAVLNAHPSHPP